MMADLKTTATEFVKSVLTLYRTAKYFREKEILSKKLLESTIEAGALISELDECDDSKKSKVASRALEELNKALFVLEVMQSENIYSARRTKPVLTLAEPLKEAIAEYIVEEQPAAPIVEPIFQPAVEPVDDGNEQLTLLPKNYEGFNDLYVEKK